MASYTPTHFDAKAAPPPFRNLFNTVSIVPPGASLAFISTQWAADEQGTAVVKGAEFDYGKQAYIIWSNICGILKELGVTMAHVVHRTVRYRDFDLEKTEKVVETTMAAIPDEWKQDFLRTSLKFEGGQVFHLPEIVYAVELIVAVPPKK